MENIALNKNHLKIGGALLSGLAVGFLWGAYYTQRTIEKQMAQSFIGNFMEKSKDFDENFKGTKLTIAEGQNKLDEDMDKLKAEFEKDKENIREGIHGK